MARTIKHQVIVTTTLAGTFRVAKILNGVRSYSSEFTFAPEAYEAAMDMAREQGKNIYIHKSDSDEFTKHACSIQDEWTVMSDDVSIVRHLGLV